MTRDEAKGLIRTLRRHLLMASLTRFMLLGIVALGIVATMMRPAASAARDPLWSAAVFAGMGWMMLAVFSARQIRATNQATAYISNGRLDLAEEQLKNAMQLFSLYRTGKLLVCHNLAVVAHGQKNYSAAAALCDGLIATRMGVSRGIGRMCRILLADCRLFLGDTLAAIRAIAPLRLNDPGMSLAEQLMLLPIELRCQVTRGDYQKAVEDLPLKVRLGEQLESPKAALVHALLAVACRTVGRHTVAEFLHRRAVLYHDLNEVAADYHLSLDSPQPAMGADNILADNK